MHVVPLLVFKLTTCTCICNISCLINDYDIDHKSSKVWSLSLQKLSIYTRLPLEERIASLESRSDTIQQNSAFGAKEMTFKVQGVGASRKHTNHSLISWYGLHCSFSTLCHFYIVNHVWFVGGSENYYSPCGLSWRVVISLLIPQSIRCKSCYFKVDSCLTLHLWVVRNLLIF